MMGLFDKLLGRDAILKAELPNVTVDLTVLGGEVRVRALNAEERLLILGGLKREDFEQEEVWILEQRVRIVRATVIDKDGKQEFTDDDLPRLKQMDSNALATLAGKAIRLSVMGADDSQEAKKNSSEATS